jgi:cytochrome c1
VGALAALAVLTGCGRPEAGDPAYTQVPGADPQRGRQLAVQHQCGRCHLIPDLPAASGRSAPSLAQFGTRSYIAGAIPNGPATLPRWIESPQALRPGSPMPDLGVPPAEARDIAAYLLSLR